MKASSPEIDLFREAEHWLRDPSDPRRWRRHWWAVRAELIRTRRGEWASEAEWFVSAIDEALTRFQPRDEPSDRDPSWEIDERELEGRVAEAVDRFRPNVEAASLEGDG